MNVILMDRGLRLLKYVIEKTDWFIVLLVVDDNYLERAEQVQVLNKGRINKCITVRQIIHSDCVDDLEYSEIAHYKSIQGLSEAGCRRIKDDYQFGRYVFFTAICFWEKIFTKGKRVDMTIIVEPLHGLPCDCILQQASLKYNVSTYNVFCHNYRRNAIYNVNENKLIKRTNLGNEIKEIHINESAHYKSTFCPDYPYSSSNSNILGRIAYNIGKMPLVRFLQCLRKWNFELDFAYNEITFKEYIFYYRYIKQLHCQIKSLYREVDYQKKYIIFFLHFEPEANVQGNAQIMDSQLVMIKMLSESLPKGWLLYVKEHPDTYKINRAVFEYFIPRVPAFNSIWFYKKLDSFENVKLIDKNESARKLIENSLAVATIAGTVILEAVECKKSVLLFAQTNLVYSLCHDFFCINSMCKLNDAIKKINGGFAPQYLDFEDRCCEYLFNDSPEGYNDIVQTLKMDYNNTLFR